MSLLLILRTGRMSMMMLIPILLLLLLLSSSFISTTDAFTIPPSAVSSSSSSSSSSSGASKQPWRTNNDNNNNNNNNRCCFGFGWNWELGPIARNGLGYEDGVLGDGRRILPGDTVYCYYVGSYAATNNKPSLMMSGPFGGLLGGGGSSGGGMTVFDSVSKCLKYSICSFIKEPRGMCIMPMNEKLC